MYKKEDVFNVLKAVDKIIPIDSYCVVYGAALVIHGVKIYTRDIDINVEDPEVFQALIDGGYSYEGCKDYKKISINGDVDLHLGGLKNRDYEVEIIRGHRVVTVKSVREEKRLNGRMKDLADISTIDKWIVDQWLSEH